MLPAACLQAKRIQPFTMPLMSLAATAIDQPKERGDVIEAMLQYLHTDPVCCRHEPGKLANLQHKASPGPAALRRLPCAWLLLFRAYRASACTDVGGAIVGRLAVEFGQCTVF